MNLNFPKKRIIAFEVSGTEVRAAVVERAGARFQVENFASLKRARAEEDLPDVETIRQLSQRLSLSGGRVVFVTPLARAFDLPMDRGKIARLKHYQLQEAVQWEVEPYTGISGQNALIGVERERKAKLRPGEIAPEESDEENVTVSAIERNVYRAAKARFKVAGFSLVRIYPPDVAFFMPLYLESGDTPRAILEVGEDYSNFAILRARVPEQINTLSISLETLSSHLSGEAPVEGLEETLRFTVRQTPAPEPLIVSGPGAVDPQVLAFISGFCPNGARPLSLSRSAGLTESEDDPANAVFGTVVGAAIRELRSPKERLIGISDRLALVPRLKKSAYLMPLVATAVFVLLLGGHYLFMQHQDAVYQQRIKTLSEELKTRKNRVAKYEGFLKELKEIEAKIDFTQRKLFFFNQEADREIIHVIDCLRGIGAAVPDNVVLATLAGDTDAGRFTITGRSYDQRAIGRFAENLQGHPWCESVVIRKVEGSSGDGALKFELLVMTRIKPA